LLVAIDGPAGSGKSSVSREAATRLGFGILDTGAAYRALTWVWVQGSGSEDAAARAMAILDHWNYETTLVGEPRIAVRVPAGLMRGDGGHAATGEAHGELGDPIDVTAEIRDPEISSRVSFLSKHPEVRERLNEMFRRIVAESGLPGVVIEGRDITTVVAPDAPVRILMTASAEVRATRRAGELPGATHEHVLAGILERDAKDALVVDFFHPAPGVTLVDTSELNFEQSVQAVVDIVTAAQHAAEKSG